MVIRSGDSVLLAELSDRCFAKLVDLVLIFVGAVIGILVMSFVIFSNFLSPEDGSYVDVFLGFTPLLALLSHEVFLTALSGKTLGKMVAGIKVVRFNDGQVPGVVRSFVRWTIPIIAGTAGTLIVAFSTTTMESDTVGEQLSVREQLLLAGGLLSWLLVYLSSLWDKNRRGWHDKIAGTVVIEEPSTGPSVHRDPSAARVAKQARRWQ